MNEQEFWNRVRDSGGAIGISENKVYQLVSIQCPKCHANLYVDRHLIKHFTCPNCETEIKEQTNEHKND